MSCSHGWSDADLSIAEPVEAVTFRTPPRRGGEFRHSHSRQYDGHHLLVQDERSGRTLQDRLTESQWYNQIAVRVGH